MLRRLLVTGSCGVLLALPAAAAGAGGPVGALQGGAGVTAPGSAVRYVALHAGPGTVVARVQTLGGTVEQSRLLRGRLGMAGVGFDGSMTGLSGDGRTLVLQGLAGYTIRHTRLLVVRTPSLESMSEVRLRGAFSVDAVSPTGRWLYLVHDFSGRGGLNYEVRAYDLVRHRLLARPVVDPREPDEKMLGVAATRAVSADGRWAYTLYDRGEQAPFVHALDTERRRAFCVDLPTLQGGDISHVRLVLDRGEGTLRVETDAGPQALVDTRTFAVRRPPAPVPAAGSGSGDGGGVPWLPAGLIAAAAVLAAAVVRLRGPRSA